MADFVAVLKKTLDALGDAPPQLRQRVYAKARTTVETKLAAITPAPPQAVVERQRQALEDAIATIEKEYADRAGPKISEDPLRELDDVFASIERQKEGPSQTQAPEVVPDPAPSSAEAPSVESTVATPPIAPPAATPPPVAPTTVAQVPPTALVRPATSDPAPVKETPAAPKPAEPASRDESWPKTTPVVKPAGKDDDGDAGPEAGNDFLRVKDDDSQFSMRGGAEEYERPGKRRGYGGLIAAVIALAVIAGGGYGIWLNKDAFAGLFGSDEPQVAATTPNEEPPADESAPADDGAADAPAAAEPDTPKFTQRLTPEGQEIDAGPAGGTVGIGEGTSLAAATQPPTTPEQTATPAAPSDAPATSNEQPGVPVGQRAIFYEERTNVAQGSAEPGNIVWSVVQESPGGDLPPEPAIRAEASIPGKDLQLRMTIRRNADQTLPASHIIEVIFLTPDGFEGGGIENILRVSMKDSEQAAGNPLIGIPAKIADGFFLVALNDGKAETEANLTLLRRQSWIDVPLIYKSGRRALFTMEKGIPGQRAFEEALKAWQDASAADDGNG